MGKHIFIAFLSLFSIIASAQVENKEIEQGNENYKLQDYAAAQNNYQSALQTNAKSEPALFNLGNALFGQKKFDEAIQQFSAVGENATDPAVRAKAYHNLGNAHLLKKEFQESVDAYKKALKANPSDMDTKYNLAYAQKKLQQQQQQQQNQDQKNKDQQQQKEKQEQQQQNQDQQNQKQEQQPPPQQKKYSKEELERIMQALNNEDKKIQEKLNKQKMQTQKVIIEKDW